MELKSKKNLFVVFIQFFEFKSPENLNIFKIRKIKKK